MPKILLITAILLLWNTSYTQNFDTTPYDSTEVISEKPSNAFLKVNPETEDSTSQSAVPQKRETPRVLLPKKQQKKMSLKRMIAIGFLTAAAIGSGTSIYYVNETDNLNDSYNEAKRIQNEIEIQRRLDERNDAKGTRNGLVGLSVGATIIGLVLWFLPE